MQLLIMPLTRTNDEKQKEKKKTKKTKVRLVDDLSLVTDLSS